MPLRLLPTRVVREPAPDDPLRALAARVHADEADRAAAASPRGRGPRRRRRTTTRGPERCPELPLHYQPIVDLATGVVAAREALVRWQDTPGGPLRPPAAFIPLAEEMGVIVEIGRRILRRACVDAAGWTDGRDRAPAVHVNLSPVELRDPGFVSGVQAALRESGLDADRLVLEVTATVAGSDLQPAIRALREVRALGVAVALDRFGTGAASLESVRALPLDWLKVGPSFTRDLTREGCAEPFVAMIVALAESLGLGVVAEGIETRPQLSAMRALGVGHGQGYFLGSPAAAAGPAFPIDEVALRV